jgi:hypothetical protein
VDLASEFTGSAQIFYWVCFPGGDVGVVVLTIGQADGGHVVVDGDVTHQLGRHLLKSLNPFIPVNPSKPS